MIGRLVGTPLRMLRRDERGAAAVEFALIAPLLLFLYFGTMEASALFSADRQVNTISATVGDLVSQWDPDDGSIPKTKMDDYFAAAQSIIYPLSKVGLKQVVSGVQVASDGTTKVLWSCGYNGGSARSKNSTYPLAKSTMMNQVTRESTAQFLVAAETSYSYKPLLGVVFSPAVNLYHENLYLPRYATQLSLGYSCS